MIYRKADVLDVDAVAELRIKLLIEENKTVPTNIKKELLDYYNKELDNNLIVTVAEENGIIVATSSVVFQQYPPSFNNKTGMRAYITNVYTLPDYRRKGINTKLMDMVVDEVKSRNIPSIWLWATESGVEFYKKYGFDELKAFMTMHYSL